MSTPTRTVIILSSRISKQLPLVSIEAIIFIINSIHRCVCQRISPWKLDGRRKTWQPETSRPSGVLELQVYSYIFCQGTWSQWRYARRRSLQSVTRTGVRKLSVREINHNAASAYVWDRDASIREATCPIYLSISPTRQQPMYDHQKSLVLGLSSYDS